MKKIVIKIGSAVLEYKGGINQGIICDVAHQIKVLQDLGYSVVIVTSGAVASCDNKSYSDSLRAAIGQPKLMSLYVYYLDEFNIKTGQFLYTHEDLAGERKIYTKKVLLEALKNGIVPIINANDSVSHDELDALMEYSDNDILAKDIALMIGAKKVLLLMDKPGLLDGEGRVVSRVGDFKEAKKLVSGERSGRSGGMMSKIAIAERLAEAGIETMLLPGKQKNAIVEFLKTGKIGTIFKVSNKAKTG